MSYGAEVVVATQLVVFVIDYDSYYAVSSSIYADGIATWTGRMHRWRADHEDDCIDDRMGEHVNNL